MTHDRQDPSGVTQLERIGSALSDPMTRNSLALMANTVLTSALGYAFWVIVARVFDSTVSGTAAATTSAIQATVLVASIGAATALVEWLPRTTTAAEWRQLVTTGIVVGACTAAAGALIVVLVLGATFRTLPQLGDPEGATLFVMACVFVAVGLVIDYVAISEHRGGLLMMRNALLCGLRIPLMFIPVSLLTAEDSILLAWTLASGLSLVWAVVGFGSRSGRSLRLSFVGFRRHLAAMASALAGQHLITVTSMLAGYVLPIIVYTRLSPADNAYFYITWMLGSVFFIISPAVSAALFVEGAANPSELQRLARRCVVTIVGLLVPPVLVYVFAGRWVLGIFGTDYADHGHLLLLILALSAVPDAITNVAVSVLRVTQRIRLALALNAGMLVGCLAGAWLVLPRLGILGAGVAWIASQAVGAAWVVARWRSIVPPETPVDHPAAESAMTDIIPLAVEGVDR